MRIPSTLTAIGREAFRFCSALTSFRIPNNLNRLGTAVFFGCYSLSSFTVGSNNRFQARDGVLFAATDGQRELVCYPAGKGGTYTIPSGVILIADYAFAIGFVQKVTIPASVSEIGYGCFDECTRLTEIEVNSGNTLYKSVDGVLLTKDGRWLLRFPGGRSGDYTVPNGVDLIFDSAFAFSPTLQRLTVPAGVTQINTLAFSRCGQLTELRFEGDAPEIAEGAFYQDSLTVYYPAEASGWEALLNEDFGALWIRWEAYSKAGTVPVLRLDGMSTRGAALSWTAVEGADRYALVRIEEGLTFAHKVESTTLLDAELLMGVRYTYRVRAMVNGVWTEYSDPVEFIFNPFSDVPSQGKTLEYVSWAFNNGIITGTSVTTFAPDASCTRVQFIMMLWKMHGSPVVEGKNPFRDISGKKTTNAILWALDQGIINRSRTFRPDGEITRVEIVMILWKLAGSPTVEGSNPFIDVSGKKTTNAVLWAYQNGITKGTSKKTFSPDAPCTRVQLVVFLYKYNAVYPVI